MINLLITLNCLALVFQLFAFYLAWRIYLYNKSNKWWLAFVFAFILQAVRRVFTLLEDMKVIEQWLITDRVFAFTISLMMVIGLWAMLKNFENFTVIEKTAHNFNKDIKRRKN